MAEFDPLAYVSQNPRTSETFDPLAYVSKPAPALSAAEETLRKTEFGARGLTDSVINTIGVIPDLVSTGLNYAGLDTPTDGFYANKLKQGWDAYSGAVNNLAGTQDAAQKVMSGPMTTADKLAYGTGRGAGDAAAIMLPAAAIAKTTKPLSMTGGVAREMASQPVVQTAAGMAGGAVGEATDSPYLAMLASLAVPAATSGAHLGKQALQSRATNQQMVKAAPTRGQLKEASNMAYSQASRVGGSVKPDSYKGLLDDMAVMVEREGGDDVLDPQVFAVLRAMGKRLGRDLDIDQLEIVRKQIGKAAGSMDPNERRLGVLMRDKLDDFVLGLGPDDLSSGSMDEAVPALKTARDLWSKNRKVEIIEEAMEKASRQASGNENGLRVQFRSILNNPKKMRGFSADEKEAMRQVAEGTPTRNALRFLGKFGIDFQQNTNALGGMLGTAGGYGVGGPIGAVALPVVGTAARYGANRGTTAAAQTARAVAATGAPMARGPIMQNLEGAGPLTSILLGREKGRLSGR